MKVFLSWSGDLSRYIASKLAEWIPPVINAVDPFISSEIEKGARWVNELSGELQGSSAGIICLTPDNLDSPWLNYEAGALSKAVTMGDEASAQPRVWTYLFRLRPADVRYPLAQFQHTEATRDDTFRLVRGINLAVSRNGERALNEAQLTKTFDRWWPALEEALHDLPDFSSVEWRMPRRPTDEMLAEILELLRTQQGSGLPRGMAAMAVPVIDPVTIHVEDGPLQPRFDFSRSLRTLRGIVADHTIGRDAKGVYLRVLVNGSIDREEFEEIVRRRAERNNVKITAIQW